MATIAEQLTSLANTKTAIKDAIVAKGVAVADTDPFSAYAGKIGQISGGSATTKYGASIDNLLGNVDANGKYVRATGSFVFNGSGIKKVDIYGFSYAFYDNDAITKLLLPDLEIVLISSFTSVAEAASYLTEVNIGKTDSINAFAWQNAFRNCALLTTVNGLSGWTTIANQSACERMFEGCKALPTTGISSLTSISGVESCRQMYKACVGLTNTELNNLTTIAGNFSCQYMFQDCTNITSIGLDALMEINDNLCCQNMFDGCTALTRAYFPSLVTVVGKKALGSSAYNGMFNRCTNITEIHFRADAQATIEALDGYANKFGATNCTIYFDLIGTITVNGVAYSRNEPNSIRVDGNKTFVAWKDAGNNIVYTNATSEPAVDTPVYSDAGTTQVGTVSGVA